MKKILVCDDVELNREIITSIFEDEYEMLSAENGEVAIALMEQYKEEIILVFLDLVMPVVDGMGVLEYMNQADLVTKIPVIMITGAATVDSDVRAYELGAADIIYKPFSRRIIIRRAMNLIELYEHRKHIEQELNIRTEELRETQKMLAKNNEFLINALSSVVEFRSLESGEHINRVRTFSEILLMTWKELHPECGFTKDDIKQMVDASALHDIGKIGIQDSILLKPGKLTEEEFEIMKGHTVIGCELLERFHQDSSDFYKYCYDICRYHHERYDGKGYPDQLKGDEIPIWAQVVSVVDVYDALVSQRVYKDAFDIEQAFCMIKNGECGIFNPNVLECLEASKDKIIAAT